MKTPALALLSTALVATLGAALLLAGPLDPPAGPVTGTHKTLSEVEPRTAINAANTPGDADSLYRITQPGSYYLTGNLAGVAAKHGIEIAASDVVIDLSGFQLLGVSGSLDGISDTAGATNVQIRNGSIRDWRDKGIDCISSESAIISDVNVRNCSGVGIAVGRYGIVSRCGSASNGGGGISTTFECVVSNCTVELNAIGGIITTTGCRVVDCAASNNAGSGISVGNGSTVTGCAASDGTIGINAADGCTIADCSAYRNSQNGINAADGCNVSNSTASDNGTHGINLGNDCSVHGCTARRNGVDGIRAASSCLITGNNCTSAIILSNGAGIHVTGNSGRVEGNSCSGHLRGIDISGGSNMITKNTCAGNATNWVIQPTNQYGPIVNEGGVSPGVNGSAAATSLSTTDPNANFTH